MLIIAILLLGANTSVMNQTDQEKDKKNEKTAKSITKALAIVGLIALLAVAAWLAVQALRSVPSLISRMSNEGAAVTLSSLFSRSRDSELSVTLDKTVVNSGEPLTLSINQTGGNGRYSISYECKDEATFATQAGDATSTNATCDTPVIITAASGTVSITPTSKSTRYLDVYMTVASIDTNGQASSDAKDTALFTVVNDAAATTKTNANTSSSSTSVSVKPVKKPQASAPVATLVYTPTPTRPVVTGPADLAVTIVGTGVSLGNNEFVKTPQIPTASRGAVKFVVENKGGQATGPWGFSANLPIEGDNDFKYTSPLQKSLNAGDKIEFVLGFDQILKESTGTIKITLLPGSTTDNAANNSAQATVVIKNK